MVRAPCCSKVGLNRGPWSAEEDALLADYIHRHGEGQWRSLPKKAGLLRCGKSCRLRWMNYLRPGIKRGNITQDEEDLIVRLHRLLGNRWSLISGRLPGRTDNEIKNHWNTYLVKKLRTSGAVKPAPRKPKKRSKNVDPKKKAEDVMITEGGGKGRAHSVSDKVKVYLPKPTRVCSVLPRTGSLDSLASGAAAAASSGGDPGSAGGMVVPEMNWDPAVFELGGAGGCYGGAYDHVDGGNDFLMPMLTMCGSMSSDDVGMFDEYFQLL